MKEFSLAIAFWFLSFIFLYGQNQQFKSEGVAFKIDGNEWTTNYLDDYWWTPVFRNLPKEEQNKIGDFIYT